MQQNVAHYTGWRRKISQTHCTDTLWGEISFCAFCRSVCTLT